MFLGLLTFPIFLSIALLSLLNKKNQQLIKCEAQMAETKVGNTTENEYLTAQAENRSPDLNKLCVGDVNRLAFNVRLNEFLLKHFPGMVRYYNDNPCSIYTEDVFFVNIVYQNGDRKKVFLNKIPSLNGASFALIDEPKPDSKENPKEDTREDPKEDPKKDTKKNPKKDPKEDSANATKKAKEKPKADDSDQNTPVPQDTDDAKAWLEKNLEPMTKRMAVAQKAKKDAFAYPVPDNEEIKEALQIEGFYVFEDSETGETFISF